MFTLRNITWMRVWKSPIPKVGPRPGLRGFAKSSPTDDLLVVARLNKRRRCLRSRPGVERRHTFNYPHAGLAFRGFFWYKIRVCRERAEVSENPHMKASIKTAYPYYLANRPESPNNDLEVFDKYSGEVATRVPLADPGTIDRAIAAAVEAAPAMARMAPCDRRAVLDHCVARFKERAEELAQALRVEIPERQKIA